ncbi:MAG: hypothetical protein GPJ54_16980 [Candidatus Heimdallarchaeota archaeon]|nr:hypothetical protein [Candidatus Heimdallarchaeota archaeon]
MTILYDRSEYSSGLHAILWSIIFIGVGSVLLFIFLGYFLIIYGVGLFFMGIKWTFDDMGNSYGNHRVDKVWQRQDHIDRGVIKPNDRRNGWILIVTGFVLWSFGGIILVIIGIYLITRKDKSKMRRRRFMRKGSEIPEEYEWEEGEWSDDELDDNEWEYYDE